MEYKFDDFYDAIVIGAGHAGCEAGLSLARLGNKTLLLTLSLDSVGFLACNPSIGGTAKGQLVCEIDALGGEMGIIADKTALQMRMLNFSKGPAVRSLRAQVDKERYHTEMKSVIENQPNLFLRQGEAEQILTENGKTIGVKTCQGQYFSARAVVVCTGVYLKGKIIVGSYTRNSGPNGFLPANHLTKSLIDLGFEIFRFKTGTPARINSNSIDFSKMEIQEGDTNIQPFSFLTKKTPKSVCPCYLTYTNEQTHQIIRDNLDVCPMISGEIVGIGPRYCPSIESKVVRFADRERHQVFLEPESASTKEFYVQGMSTSMPVNIQKEMYSSIAGLENAFIMRDAYAIEYDCIDSTSLLPTLMSKNISGLFFAGQVNGTSGYEEAGAQGIIAGINANQFLKGKNPLILKRNEAYIGVLIDDLVTKGTNEPYRMMTSRAEYRLLLREDNADTRLTPIGRKIGLVDDKRWKAFTKKCNNIEKAKKLLSTKIKADETLEKLCEKCGEKPFSMGSTIYSILKRPSISIFDFSLFYDIFSDFDASTLDIIDTTIKYEGYIKQQEEDIEKSKKFENELIPPDFDYSAIKGLKCEAIQKLSKIKPLNLGQAGRISGVSPADIAVLSVAIKFFKEKK